MHSNSLPVVLSALIALCRVARVSYAARSPAYPCPDLDGTSYPDATGSSYKIQCSTDYSGNDLPAVHTDTFEGCLRACDSYMPTPSAADDASCIDVSWGAGNPGGNCYLKYQITTINPNDVGFSSGYYVNYTLPASAATSPGNTPSTTTSAPAMSGTQTVTSIPPAVTPSGSSNSHVAIGVGAGVGVGVGVPVISAILVGFFCLRRRRSRTRTQGPRPEERPETDAKANDKETPGLREPSADRWLVELPAEKKHGELFDPRGPRAEFPEIRGTRAEMG